MDKKLIYVADNLYPHFTGGAEINDHVLLSLLEKSGVQVVKFQSQELFPKHVEMYIKRGYKFLVSNFLKCPVPTLRQLLANPNSYSIIEHDHKYLKTRDPSKYENFQAPSSEVVNKPFY